MISRPLAGTLLLLAAVTAWTWWAFHTEFRAKPGMPARAQAVTVAFFGWYMAWGLWRKITGRAAPERDREL